MYINSLADFISRLNVAKASRVKSVFVANTKLNLQLLAMFLELGIIKSFFVDAEDHRLRIEVFLRFGRGQCSFKKICLVSKPSKHIYVNLLNLLKLKRNSKSFGFFIISTEKGLLFDYECFSFNIGGEVILKIIL